MKNRGEKPAKFIPPDKLDGRVGHSDDGLGPYGKARDWAIGAHKREKRWTRDENGKRIDYEPRYDYIADRIEGLDDKGSVGGINRIHRVSFLNEIIPAILERKKREGKKEKCRILDIGGGAGEFAKQIRDKFGERVEVFTTGLKKSTARIEARRKLHKNDLKWRSVRQLSDFEEFDLILDTLGEFLYGTEYKPEKESYIMAVIKKLKPGGMASLLLPDFNTSEEDEFFDFLSNQREKEKFNYEKDGKKLRIYKNEIN